MQLTFDVEVLDEGRVHRYLVRNGSDAVPWADVFKALKVDERARRDLSEAIAAAPFDEVFFETPAHTTSTLGDAAEFVLVDAPLRRSADPSAFAEHFRDAEEQLVTTFANLRADAILVVPNPLTDGAQRNYLRSFLRTAPEEQIQSFWAQAALAVQQRVNEVPVWVSTSGGGVPWLHLRLDDRPKYYTHRPYSQS